MARTNLFLVTSDGVMYQIGRVGVNFGTLDDATTAQTAAYTGRFKTERFSPAGEHGYNLFRRVALRVFHTGAFSCTIKVYVDDVQTKIWSGGSEVDQSVAIAEAAPATSPHEARLEADIEASGTSIQAEVLIGSAGVTGIVLPETLEVHYRPIRPARQQAAETS